MALFKRKNQDTTEEVPPEVQEYYQAEKRERTGVAWLLAIATLVVTVLLAAALFFGGRWVYQNVFNSDDTPQETSSTDTVSPSDPGTVSEDGDEGDTTPPPSGPEDSETSPSSPPAPGQAGTPAPGSSSSDTSGNGQTSSTTTDTPSTGADEEPLPETGPADTLAIFLAVTVMAYVLHYAVAAKSRG